jgi:hypothetical protein
MDRKPKSSKSGTKGATRKKAAPRKATMSKSARHPCFFYMSRGGRLLAIEMKRGREGRADAEQFTKEIGLLVFGYGFLEPLGNGEHIACMTTTLGCVLRCDRNGQIEPF